MEIKELVRRVNELKRLRNTFEVKMDELIQEYKNSSAEAQAEADNRDRMGLGCYHLNDFEDLNKGINQMDYGIKYLNEGIGLLDAAYRKAVRFKQIQEQSKPQEEKKPE